MRTPHCRASSSKRPTNAGRSLRDQQAGGLYLYSDVNQRVFARFGEPPVPLVFLMLDHNLRNTRQIGELINPWHPTGCACWAALGRR